VTAQAAKVAPFAAAKEPEFRAASAAPMN